MFGAFRTQDLLRYDADHRVLLCRECQYAIQKSALGSHLLRHKIYRGERQRLLSALARLELPEPDDVRLPPAGSPPVDGLPVVAGYRCTAVGCQSLCASSKRMKRHWSETHGTSDPPQPFASSVHLQTFFRGTKLRYFEVAAPSRSPGGSALGTGDGRSSLLAPLTPCAQVSVPDRDLDLESLRYFHHFTTATSLTLPTESQDPVKYWTVDVVAKAMQLRWLMWGLLAISAAHLAALSADESDKRAHWERSIQFFEVFSAGWEAVLRGSDVAGVEGAEAAAQIICIQRCCHWTLEAQDLVHDPSPLWLRSFIATVRGCLDPKFALRSAGTGHVPPERPFDDSNNDSRAGSLARDRSNASSAVLDRLRTLPFRMAEVLERPDDVEDFFAALSAIDALAGCYSSSCAFGDTRAVRMIMESWFGRLSNHFNQMLWQRSPTALVVLAHWAALVERTEQLCWFLKGSAAMVLLQIAWDLPEGSPVQRMVKSLTTENMSIASTTA